MGLLGQNLQEPMRLSWCSWNRVKVEQRCASFSSGHFSFDTDITISRGIQRADGAKPNCLMEHMKPWKYVPYEVPVMYWGGWILWDQLGFFLMVVTKKALQTTPGNQQIIDYWLNCRGFFYTGSHSTMMIMILRKNYLKLLKISWNVNYYKSCKLTEDKS